MTEIAFERDSVRRLVKRLARQIEGDRTSAITEAKTVLKYVIPLLEALGWRVAEDRLVPEYPVKGSSVDIALLVGGKPVIFVEAKRLREDLSLKEREAEQVLDYGYKSGTNWCVLTNGERYEIYDAFARVDHAKKLVTSFSLLETAKNPQAELPKVRLLSYEAITTEDLAKFAKEQFASARVYEVLRDPPSGVISALCGQLRECGMSQEDVQLGLTSVLPDALVVAPPPIPEPGTPPAPPETHERWGIRSFREPLRRAGDVIIVAKYRVMKKSVEPQYVRLETIRRVARAVYEIAQSGDKISVPGILARPKAPSHSPTVRGLGALWVAGVLRDVGWDAHKDWMGIFELAEDLTAEAMVDQVLEQAEPLEGGEDPKAS